MSESGSKSSTGLQPNVAGFLCYLAWWVTGVIFLIIEKENQFVRFHAMQSIILFVALWVLAIVLAFIPFIGWIIGILLWILTVIVWIVCMYKAYRGEKWKVPVVGNIAENFVKPK